MHIVNIYKLNEFMVHLINKILKNMNYYKGARKIVLRNKKLKLYFKCIYVYYYNYYNYDLHVVMMLNIRYWYYGN
jgi:hypothetical protein